MHNKVLAEKVRYYNETEEGEVYMCEYEFVKRIVLAWDPDFTKATTDELRQMEEAEAELSRGEYYTHDQINWD